MSEKKKKNLEHEVRAIINPVEVAEGEPFSKSGTDLIKAAKQDERFSPIDGGDLRDAIFGQGIGLGGGEVEEVAGALGEGVEVGSLASEEEKTAVRETERFGGSEIGGKGGCGKE